MEYRYIDAHTHIFEVLKGFGAHGEFRAIGGGKARWADGHTQPMIPEGYGDKEFRTEAMMRMLDEAHVEKAVLLQGGFYGFQNEYVAEALAAYPDRLIGAATFDPFTRFADKVFDRLEEEFSFQAVKFEVSTVNGFMGSHPAFVIDEVLGKYFPKIAEKDQTLVFDIGSCRDVSYQPEAIRRIALQYPGLHIVVCHLMAPGREDEEILKASLSMLALPNVWFDLAAVPYNTMPEEFPYPVAQRHVRTAMDLVGAEKLIWGTDIPSVICFETYAHLRDYLKTVPGITEKELEGMYYGNACAAYRFA